MDFTIANKYLLNARVVQKLPYCVFIMVFRPVMYT